MSEKYLCPECRGKVEFRYGVGMVCLNNQSHDYSSTECRLAALETQLDEAEAEKQQLLEFIKDILNAAYNLTVKIEDLPGAARMRELLKRNDMWSDK